MEHFENLTCPACGKPSERPLASYLAQPLWRCGCGYTVTLPVAQVQAMLARIEVAKRLVRFTELPTE